MVPPFDREAAALSIFPELSSPRSTLEHEATHGGGLPEPTEQSTTSASQERLVR